ncbi:unnamed protein product [Cylindrotheca closterium]|uniref:Uncharacterized protein n=1 Tax=Cylindrotheca closterium TaxID=2856 RepID=A0AAD2CQF6_9STRA|nr:unnamed protein product [Cylindrotheca closterium]
MMAAILPAVTESDNSQIDGDNALQYLNENQVRGELHCSSMFNDDQVIELENIVRRNHSAIHLTSLKLANNGLTENSTTALANILTHQVETLRDLDLTQNPLKHSGLTPLVDQLIAGRPVSQLHTLNLTKTMLGNQGASALASLLRFNTSLRHLNLSSNKLGNKGIKTLAPALQNNSHLETLNVSNNNISSVGGNFLAKEIQAAKAPGVSNIISNLRHLDISFNKIKDSGIQAFATLLRTENTFESFCAESTSLGPDGAFHLAPVLEFNHGLRVLKLGGNQIGSEGVEVLMESLHNSQSSNLEELDLAYNAVGREGAESIAHELAENSNLKVLNLNGNTIGSAGCALLAQGLQYSLSLRHLVLTNNNIDNQGAFEMAVALGKPSCKIETKNVLLDDNPITDAGITALERVQKLKNNQKYWLGKLLQGLEKGVIFSVDLQYKDIGDTEVLLLLEVLADHNPLIRTFFLNGKNLTSKSLIPLFQFALTWKARILRLFLKQCSFGPDVSAAFRQSLVENSTLEVCSLIDCSIDSNGISEIAEGLKYNKTLRRLNLDRNCIRDDGLATMLSILPHPSLTALCVSKNGITDQSMSNPALAHLTELNLNGNLITSVGGAQLSAALVSSRMERLGLWNNKLGEDQRNAIKAFLPNTHCEF